MCRRQGKLPSAGSGLVTSSRVHTKRALFPPTSAVPPHPGKPKYGQYVQNELIWLSVVFTRSACNHAPLLARDHC